MPDITWVTTQQAADILGVKRKKVLDLIATDRLNAKRVGRDYFINADDLESIREKIVTQRRLTEEEIQEIRERKNRGESVVDLAKYYHVQPLTIYRRLKTKDGKE